MTKMRHDRPHRDPEPWWDEPPPSLPRDERIERPVPGPAHRPVTEIWEEIAAKARNHSKLTSEAAEAYEQSFRSKGKRSRQLGHEAVRKRGTAKAIIPEVIFALGLLRAKGASIPFIQRELRERHPELADVLDDQDAWRNVW